MVELEEELLVIVSWPVRAPAVVGANWTYKVAVWPGLSVTGNVMPEMEKPAPVTVAALTVTAAVPVEERIKD